MQSFAGNGQDFGDVSARGYLLRKDILADGFLALLEPKLTQQCNDLRVHINGAVSTILRGIQIDALVRGITEVAADGDGVLCKVHIFPLQSAAFAPADSGVDQQTDHCPPFQWLLR